MTPHRGSDGCEGSVGLYMARDECCAGLRDVGGRTS